MQPVMTQLAPAKINLYLGVHTARDERGYHLVDTVMAPLALADTVVLQPTFKLSLKTVPFEPCSPHKNLAYRAAEQLCQVLRVPDAFDIRVHKRIPSEAGLGGGSSDAAAVLRAIAQQVGVSPTSKPVVKVAQSLGADVAFFLYGQPAELSGVGDQMASLFDAIKLPLVLVRPQGPGASTPLVYAAFDASPVEAPPMEPLVEALKAGNTDALVQHLANNLEPAAVELVPAVGEVLTWLNAQPEVRAAHVCGSGSCTFAITTSMAASQALAREARAHGWWATSTYTC